jgi:Ca2+/Na+ antiporter
MACYLKLKDSGEKMFFLLLTTLFIAFISGITLLIAGEVAIGIIAVGFGLLLLLFILVYYRKSKKRKRKDFDCPDCGSDHTRSTDCSPDCDSDCGANCD